MRTLTITSTQRGKETAIYCRADSLKTAQLAARLVRNRIDRDSLRIMFGDASAGWWEIDAYKVPKKFPDAGKAAFVIQSARSFELAPKINDIIKALRTTVARFMTVTRKRG